jgi:phage baseplate assembly protein W
MRLSGNGAFGLVSDATEIEQSIRLVLGTAPGERPMRPEFGCAAYELVFGGADATTAGRLAHEVRRALDRWEPRIVVEDVLVSRDPDDPGRLYVSLRYAVRATNDVRNLVFPFYTLPPGNAP